MAGKRFCESGYLLFIIHFPKLKKSLNHQKSQIHETSLSSPSVFHGNKHLLLHAILQDDYTAVFHAHIFFCCKAISTLCRCLRAFFIFSSTSTSVVFILISRRLAVLAFVPHSLVFHPMLFPVHSDDESYLLVASLFPLTTATVLPLMRRFAIMLRIVWVLPVPGGPPITEIVLSRALRAASSCDSFDVNGAMTGPESGCDGTDEDVRYRAAMESSRTHRETLCHCYRQCRGLCRRTGCR